MSRTLILLFHPDLANSRANAAMAQAAGALPGIEVADLHALYPDGRIDADVEVARLLGADRIVLQFPVQWYSTPPLLKAWQDLILTRMFYIDYEHEGSRLEGRPLLVAATAGNVPQAYSPDGQNLHPLTDLLKPLQSTAHRCGLPWAEPHLLYRANRLNEAELAAAANAWVDRLRHWIATGAATPLPAAQPTVASKPRRDPPVPAGLGAAALSLPLIVAAELALAAPWSTGPEVSAWRLALGAALMLPIGWLFFSALLRAGARPVGSWARLAGLVGVLHMVMDGGWGRATTGAVLALAGLVIWKKTRSRPGDVRGLAPATA